MSDAPRGPIATRSPPVTPPWDTPNDFGGIDGRAAMSSVRTDWFLSGAAPARPGSPRITKMYQFLRL